MINPTEKDTYDHIIGSGALTHSWYQQVQVSGVPADPLSDDLVAYMGWSVSWLDEDSGKRFTVAHRSVLRAMSDMLKAKDKRPQYVSDAAARECRNFIFDRDETDFDAATADEVLQVCAFGKVVYG